MASSEVQPVPVLGVQDVQRIEKFIELSQDIAAFDKTAKNAAVHTLAVLYDALHDKHALQWPAWLACDDDDVDEQGRNEALSVLGALLRAMLNVTRIELTRRRGIARNLGAILPVLGEYWPAKKMGEAPLIPRRRSEQATALAFENMELCGSGGSPPSQTLLRTLSAYAHDYRDRQAAHNYHSPYAALVGPSGIGKSFTVKQLAVEQGVFVVYASLGDRHSTAFPSRSPIAQTIQQLPTLEAAETFWYRYAAVASDLVRCAVDAAMTPGQLFCLLADASFADTQDKIAALVGSDEDQHKRRTTLRSLLVDAHVAPMGRACNDNASFFVLAVDEAMPLLASTRADSAVGSDDDGDDAPFRFRGFRRGLAAFYGHGHGHGRGHRPTDAHRALTPFGLVVATSSRVANFVPVAFHHHSAKRTRAIRLFPPIHKLPTWDIVPRNTPLLTSFFARLSPANTPCALIQVNLDEEAALWQYVQFTAGRPLWGAMLGVFLNQWYIDDDSSAALRAASDKVLGLAETKLFDPTLSDDASMLALLSVRLSFDVREKRLAETLSSRAMHFIIHISDDGSILGITQPSEPILVRAAMGVLQDRNVRRLAVHAFWGLFSQGAINAGDMGERVAALLLLFAADVDALRHRMPTTVSLQSLLAALVGPMQDAWVDEEVRIHLTHFSRLCVRDGRVGVGDGVDPLLLQTAFVMGQGWFLEKNCPGADLLVPCWNKTTRRMSALLVQVKNRLVPHHITPSLVQTAKADFVRAKQHLSCLGDVPVYGLYLNLRPTDGDDGDDGDDGAHVRWGSPDTTHKLQVGIVIGFSRRLFPVLDEEGEGGPEPLESLVDRSGPCSIERALAAMLAYAHDKDMGNLLWTRGRDSMTG